MKKALKRLVAVAASVVSYGAIAAPITNVENPLYIPKAGEIYSKTGAAIMYKKVDSTSAQQKKHHDGAIEFPIWRFTEDLGIGVTDRLSVNGKFGYTHNGDIDRKGLHRGRLGLNYRLVESADNIVWDFYGEAYLSGLSPMKGSYSTNGFTYDNFSNGRWGVIAGTKFGKTWNKFTLSMFVEHLQTFGNHNNKIKLDSAFAAYHFPSEISVNLKSTTETNFGLNGFYQLNDRWSFGAGLEFNQHTDNGVQSIHTKLDPTAQNIANALFLAETKDMNEGWEEYIVKGVLANQITETTQIALFAEYTFDQSHTNSQNGTDIKVEAGLRLNLRF